MPENNIPPQGTEAGQATTSNDATEKKETLAPASAGVTTDDALEKQETLDLFKEGLVAVLEMSEPEDAELIEVYNVTLMRIMLEDENFKKELEKTLSDNQEKLTFKEFELDDKPIRPTVANWLKDFIKQEGAEIFDNVSLSRYITNSKNAKLLSEEERQLVRKLLVLYRNLKFFPESMPNETGEGWEIIPVEKEEMLTKVRSETLGQTAGQTLNVEEARSKTLNVKGGLSISGDENKMKELQKLAEQYPEGPRTRTLPPRRDSSVRGSSELEDSDKENKIDELKKLANEYPEGSLERRAIDEEIQKVISHKS